MPHYLLHTTDGLIVRWGYHDAPQTQVEPGLLLLAITPQQYANVAPALQRVQEGQLVERSAGDRDTAPAWAEVRARRNSLLGQCDWVALRANELGEPIPANWRAYRQALRDVTLQPDPFSISWPTPPES